MSKRILITLLLPLGCAASDSSGGMAGDGGSSSGGPSTGAFDAPKCPARSVQLAGTLNGMDQSGMDQVIGSDIQAATQGIITVSIGKQRNLRIEATLPFREGTTSMVTKATYVITDATGSELARFAFSSGEVRWENKGNQQRVAGEGRFVLRNGTDKTNAAVTGTLSGCINEDI